MLNPATCAPGVVGVMQESRVLDGVGVVYEQSAGAGSYIPLTTQVRRLWGQVL